MSILYAFILGSHVASFLILCAWRLPSGQPIILSRSCCEHCHRQLPWRDLLPIISFIHLKGRCRFCQQKITKTQWFGEWFGGISVAYLVAQHASVIHYYLLAWLFLVSFIDCYHFCFYPYISSITFLPILIDASNHLQWLAVISIFGVLYLFSRYFPLGFGDLELITLLSLLLGYEQILLWLLFACLLGIIKTLCCKNYRAPIPFIPYLAISFLGVSYF